MKKIIEIKVTGATGTGKTEVVQVIENALKDFYGPHTQVVSYDLSLEKASAPKGDVLGEAKATGQCCKQQDTVFILSETGEHAFARKSIPAETVTGTVEKKAATKPAVKAVKATKPKSKPTA